MLLSSRIRYYFSIKIKIKGNSYNRQFSHVPVMAKEIVELLRPQDGKVFIDMTFGSGGHTKSLLETNHSIKVIAVDRDPMAIKRAHELAAQVAIKSQRLGIQQTVIPIHGKFSQIIRDIHLSGVPFGSVNGVLFDLGASSMQYDDPSRGFALSSNGPLDMRMDTTNSSDITAEDVVNNLSQEKLALIFKTLGEERRSRKFASAILDARTLLGRIKTTHELAKVLHSSSPSVNIDSLGRYSHPGTKVFQAIRIFVNNELNELNYALTKIRDFLIPMKSGEELGNSTTIVDDETIPDDCGLAAVLTFHSLEDRIVKRHFTGIDINEPVVKALSQHDRIRTNFCDKSIEEVGKQLNDKKWKQLTKHVRKPTEEEMAANPKSRSAKLRAAIRLS